MDRLFAWLNEHPTIGLAFLLLFCIVVHLLSAALAYTALKHFMPGELPSRMAPSPLPSILA